MAGLRTDVELGYEDALASVDRIGSGLDDVVARFTDSLTSALDSVATSTAIDIPVVADVTQAEADIATLDAGVAAEQLVLPLEADASPAEGAVTSLVAQVDAEQATIEVDADTSQAESNLTDLGTAADSAGGAASKAQAPMTGLADSAGLVAGGAALARGEVGGLSEVAGGLGVGTAGAVGGVAALAGSVYFLAQAGLDATSAEQRFNAILGDSAKAVLDVHVGDFTANVYDLGIKFGSTNAAMQNSVATVYQHATAAGFAADKSRTYADELVAMAARAVAINPALGSIGDVVDNLEMKFARSRGLVQYGISISQAEINTRAMTDAGVDSAANLTVQDKAYAGLQIAVEKYGTGLNDVIAKGARNAANEQRSFRAELDQSLEDLGKPLTAPFLATLKAAVPDVVAIATPLAEIGADILPAVASALAIAGPPLQAVAGFIHDLPGPLVQVAVGLVLATQILPGLTSSLLTNAAAWGLMGEEAASNALEMGVATSALTADVSLMEMGLGQAALAAGAFFVGWEIGKAIVNSFSNDAGPMMQKTLDAEAASAKNAAQATKGDLIPAWNDLVRTVDQGNRAIVAAQAMGMDTHGAVTMVGTLEVQLRAFRDLAEQSLPQAAAVAASTNKNTAEYRGMANILAELAAKQKQHSDEMAKGQVLLESVTSAEATATSTVAAYAAGQTDAASTVKALSAAESDLKASMDLLLGDFLSADQANVAYLNSVAKMNDTLVANAFNLDTTTQAGRDNESAILAAGSAAEAWSSAITKSGGSVKDAVAPLQSYHDNLQRIRDALAAAGGDTSFVDGLLSHAQQAIDGLNAKSPEFAAAAKANADAATAAIAKTASDWRAVGELVAEQARQGVDNAKFAHAIAGREVGQAGLEGLGGTRGEWSTAGAANAAAGASGVSSRAGDSRAAGHEVGQAGVDGASGWSGGFFQAGADAAGGFASGLSSGIPFAQTAAGDLARKAHDTLTTVLQTGSPSKLTRDEAGVPFGQGFALGITDTTALVEAAAGALASGAVAGARVAPAVAGVRIGASAPPSGAAPAGTQPGGETGGRGGHSITVHNHLHVRADKDTPDHVVKEQAGTYADAVGEATVRAVIGAL